MSPLPELSNEQKLTYIYHTLHEQESRRKRAIWYKIFKWLLFIGIAYLIATYPKEIMGKATELLRPIIMEQVDAIMEQNKNNLIKSLKDVLPSNIEISSSKPKTTPVNQSTTPTKTKTGTTTPVKK